MAWRMLLFLAYEQYNHVVFGSFFKSYQRIYKLCNEEIVVVSL